ncbi:hypothetical protein CN242_23540, partial [Sinorhizobium meliloti]
DTPHLQSLRRHPVPSSSRRRKKLHTSRTPTPDASLRGRHHLGIRGRLFLGIGGRDHFGIRGRIASEFARCGHGPAIRTSRVPLLRIGNIDAIVIASNWSWQLP